MIEIRREASHDSSVDPGGGEEESYDHSRIEVDNEEEDDEDDVDDDEEDDEDPDEDEEEDEEHRSDGKFLGKNFLTNSELGRDKLIVLVPVHHGHSKVAFDNGIESMSTFFLFL